MRKIPATLLTPSDCTWRCLPPIRSFLAEKDARSMTVRYRANRAVIFDSDLFHETDRIAFQSGYTNRRVNITLLCGRRRSHEGLA